jgi:DNA-binding transcriptional LysR family regulator
VVVAERSVGGRDAGLAGSVRITTSEWLAVRLVGPVRAPLLEAHLGQELELVADARHLDLIRKEADLALRPSRFTHEAVFQRRVATLDFALYASRGYLLRHGAPQSGTQSEGHRFIAFDKGIGDVARGWMTAQASRASVVMRTNGREAMATMAASGIGLACLPRLIGATVAELREVTTLPPLRPLALWLGAHRDARSIPRVRAVMSFLGDALRAA